MVSRLLDHWRATRHRRVVPRIGNRGGRCRRRGQALLEFAIIALVLYLLLAVVLEFGRVMWIGQSIQNAADVAARELARAPIAAGATWADALADPQVQATIYSEDFLAIDITDQGNQTLIQYLDSLQFDGRSIPIVNRMLAPTMVISQVNGRTLLRYPGALVTSETAPSGYTVKVPLVAPHAADEPETITWASVLEEVPHSVDGAPPQGMFSVASPLRGFVSVRLNYPFQAAAMSAYEPVPVGGTEGNLNRPYLANDSQVSADDLDGSLVAPDVPEGSYAGPNGGEYGLGELGALAQTVRPFRRVLVGQGMARREMFGN